MSLPADLSSQARTLMRARLSERSYAHCERVASSARELALRHGVDPSQAELAGLLHDYSRDESEADLLDGARDMGIQVLPLERQNPYLLHGPVGAARLREALGDIPASVLAAVSAHTVGAVPMSGLDEVIFLADMIEPERRYPGVDELRVSCRDDCLTECFRRGYELSVRRVRECGKPLHPITSEVTTWLDGEVPRRVSG